MLSYTDTSEQWSADAEIRKRTEDRAMALFLLLRSSWPSGLRKVVAAIARKRTPIKPRIVIG